MMKTSIRCVHFFESGHCGCGLHVSRSVQRTISAIKSICRGLPPKLVASSVWWYAWTSSVLTRVKYQRTSLLLQNIEWPECCHKVLVDMHGKVRYHIIVKCLFRVWNKRDHDNTMGHGKGPLLEYVCSCMHKCSWKPCASNNATYSIYLLVPKPEEHINMGHVLGHRGRDSS